MTPQTQTAAVGGAGERLAIQEVSAAQSLQMLSGRSCSKLSWGKSRLCRCKFFMLLSSKLCSCNNNNNKKVLLYDVWRGGNWQSGQLLRCYNCDLQDLIIVLPQWGFFSKIFSRVYSYLFQPSGQACVNQKQGNEGTDMSECLRTLFSSRVFKFSCVWVMSVSRPGLTFSVRAT